MAASQTSLLFGILAILLFVRLSQSQEEELQYGPPCETPNDTTGFCVLLLQCKSAIDLMDKVEEVPDNVDYLRRSKCGGNGTHNITVCCPITDLREDLDRKATTLLPARSVCGHHWAHSVPDDTKTKLNEFPWTAQLWYNTIRRNQKTTICNGVLINQDHVLSTPSCTLEPLRRLGYLNLEFVRLGDWDASSPIDCSKEHVCADPVLDIAVAEVIEHENYVEGIQDGFKNLNDIAVIRLSRKVINTDYIRPICLPSRDLADSHFEGKDLVATGWDRTSAGVLKVIKRKLTLTGASRGYCSNIHQQIYKFGIDARQLCADGVKDPEYCRGDYGAALMAFNGTDPGEKYWYLVGLTSFWPVACGEERTPNVYTRASFYHDWIISKLR